MRTMDDGGEGMNLLRWAVLPVLLGLAMPALADAPAPTAPTSALQIQVDAALAAAPAGTRFGLLVVDEAGQVLVSVNPDGRFIPASNTKLFTTAAAYALLLGMDQPDVAGGTQVALLGDKRKRAPDVVLIGRGDARMSSASDCKVDCLATLADAVAARTKIVGDVVGDDSIFPDERWSPGMSWNNIQTEDGTAAGALNLDDNQLKISVFPGQLGKPPTVAMSTYYVLTNEAVTVAAGGTTTLAFERVVGSNRLRLYGEIPADAKDWHQWIGIDDPAHYSAWTFKALLEARGVRVTGRPRSMHRASIVIDRACNACMMGIAKIGAPVPFAALDPAPLSDDVVTINKVSQNLHAQVLFRRVGYVLGTGSSEWAVRAEQILFDQAGIPRKGYDFFDGSGMSTYNRVSPRAAVSLLRWAAIQPWGQAWYASFPVAGVDGTLQRRFIGTPLAGNLAAKTGSLNATNALSGTFRGASGRRLTFAFFANDVPDGESALPVMEAVLLLVAAQN